MTKIKNQNGFTLLEVLVALAIFATTALVLMKIAMNNTQSVQLNQLRTKAHFVAMNSAAEINIDRQWLTGSSTTQREEQGEQWQIIQTATPTLSENIQKIDIQVLYIDPDTQSTQGITTLSMFNYRNNQATP